ncbi:MAG TPA: Asp-tRNA(Asn)/Glu-tRNA(Gln) amidotransferase subunit GatA [Candidatus Eisenbacteria bacterium]|nr:Asp-tRNA(Asn)/Glu-tRNA(Gln) amidotransferase subunit GatA [Candidatus Eisenbacteria bacterium]
MSLATLTIHELSQKLRQREVSAEEITRDVLGRIESTEGTIHSFITVLREPALEAAKAADERFHREPDPNPLLGIPLAVKDNVITRGIRTTAGSKILDDFLPPYDATVSAKLRAAGAVIIGKTNMDEFAMGSSAENSAFFPTRNPWDTARVPGGSSGGSAAAVAADQCAGALGTDTGGSIRQPAACCGIVGLKPTYGRVSRFGIIAFASSMDQVGPLTKDVTDCALLLEAIAGHDPSDSTSVDRPVPRYSEMLAGGVQGFRVGIPKEYFISGVQPEVERAVGAAIRVFQDHGAIIEEISLPHTEYAVAAYYIVATAEASSNLARYDGMRYGYRARGRDLTETYTLTRAQAFGAEVKRRIILGTYVLSAGYYDAYYLKAQKVRTLIRRDFDEAFSRCDILLTPTAPTTAFRLGEKIKEPLQMYLSDVFTIPANLAGLPALSVPCGFDAAGLPVGLQLIGRHFEESKLLRAAYAYEQATRWGALRPVLESA